MSGRGNIREFDRTKERAFWMSHENRNLPLIRDSEADFNKSLPENKNRQRVKDNIPEPVVQLISKLHNLGLTLSGTKFPWEFTKYIRGGVNLWNRGVFVRDQMFWTQEREWRNKGAAKIAASLEALTF